MLEEGCAIFIRFCWIPGGDERSIRCCWFSWPTPVSARKRVSVTRDIDADHAMLGLKGGSQVAWIMARIFNAVHAVNVQKATSFFMILLTPKPWEPTCIHLGCWVLVHATYFNSFETPCVSPSTLSHSCIFRPRVFWLPEGESDVRNESRSSMLEHNAAISRACDIHIVSSSGR